MPNTYELIASSTVGSGGASTIDFTSIPQTYTDLLLVLSARVGSTFGNAWYDTYLKVNSASGTTRDLYGTGASVSAGSDTEIRILGVNSSGETANTFSSAFVYITNYSSTTQNKHIGIESVTENNATGAMAQLGAAVYASNTAITSLSLDPYSTASFVQYTKAYLYGIKNS